MDRRKRVIQKRNAKQRKADAGVDLSRTGYWGHGRGPEAGSKLIFKPKSAGIAGAWQPGSPNEPPVAPEAQP
jgi:hypothetical protein